MSFLDIHAPVAGTAGRSRLERVFTALRKAREAQVQHFVYRQTVRELQGLSDRQLDDLGINRATIEDTARKAAYRR